MADWEEIKRLAADFQRTQTSDTLQRISERNCIDIVKKLTDLNLIELIYTCDGKEFITPSHLLKEIEDEVYVNAGRVHLHDVAATLNVDYQHVENTAKQIAAEQPDDYNLILGQIIHSTYKLTLEKQIGDTMLATGQLSIADFAKSLDLPSEFLTTVVRELLPRIMSDHEVSQDGKTYYTADMMDRYRSVIAGTLSAITKPTTIASIMKKLDISERLFAPIVDGLLKEGRIDAIVENRLFVPAVYAREQNEWIDKFYSSNSYIEYDVLIRKDIKQPKAFLRKRFPEGHQLKTCYVSPSLVSQLESLIEDCIATNGLIDISSILPASIQPEDIEQLLQDIFKKNKQFGSSCLVLSQTNVCSLGYIATCKESFNSIMEARAREQLQQGKLMNYFLGGSLKSGPVAKQKKQEQQQPPPQPRDVHEAESQKKVAESENKGDSAGGEASPSTEPENKPPPSGDKQNPESSTKKKAKGEEIELTAEDLKRERRQKKGARATGAVASSPAEEAGDDQSDEEQGAGKKSKGSRKSGGGAQGREIKQKAVKKKYLAGSGKGAQRNNDASDDEQAPATKQSRSNKGRVARRAASPEPPGQASTAGPRASAAAAAAQGAQGGKLKDAPQTREPLAFLASDELIGKLREQTRESGDFSDELLGSLAQLVETDLNRGYEVLARRMLDEYLRSEAQREASGNSAAEDEGEIELVE